MSKVLTFVARELREALPAFLFFLVAFHMIALSKTVLLEHYEITAVGVSIATIGALIVAKAILVVESLPLARLFSRRTLANVLWKTLLFGVVAMLFRVLEELIPIAFRHGGVVAAAERTIDAVPWPYFWIFQMWLFALLFLYCLAAELVRMVGAATVRGMLLDAKEVPTEPRPRP
jgi:hypothetical protein